MSKVMYKVRHNVLAAGKLRVSRTLGDNPDSKEKKKLEHKFQYLF